jgi:hypothetical protein
MSKPSRLLLKIPVFVLSTLQVLTSAAWGQAPAAPATTPELYFYVRPSKQFFSRGETVTIAVELYSRSEQALLVSRRFGDDFMTFKAIGPDGNEVPWQSKAGAVPKKLAASDFNVLGQYKEISANRIISLKDGTGFAFDKPGQYLLIAEFSMGPPENFAPFESQARAPTGSFQSKVGFCIEACILEPRQVSANVPRAALDAVREFYTYITRYHQLGIPYGPARKALWPLLSKRLVHELDGFQTCDDDYYRRYGEILRANTYKPSTPWLEEGLFTGPDDAATPRIFRILGSSAIGKDRVDVELGFTTKQTYSPDLHLPPSYDHYEGDVTVILQNNRWVVDDYVAMYENDDLERLSAGFSDCNGGKWVGKAP